MYMYSYIVCVDKDLSLDCRRLRVLFWVAAPRVGLWNSKIVWFTQIWVFKKVLAKSFWCHTVIKEYRTTLFAVIHCWECTSLSVMYCQQFNWTSRTHWDDQRSMWHTGPHSMGRTRMLHLCSCCPVGFCKMRAHQNVTLDFLSLTLLTYGISYK